ncbi:glycosyl transferase, WecB/TagA/CpsF family [Leptothrix cholodnii SP-6]|uniref:Glycosyl transferase, WecB/TagA/CpsF family n=2 Tax=Leptothrix cholodnii TaxID=34029 RepID=B1Y484_LEPCP|nr:glycosyl transferase, WecB/TagA/CpsF family [Leptothrix cholodnii SP-6]
MVDKAIPCVELEGVPFSCLGLAETGRYIVEAAKEGRGGWVVTPNVDIVRRIVRDALFKHLVSSADIFTPDGAPIVWAARLRGDKLAERVPGSDLFLSVCEKSARGGLPVALIGGNPGVAEAAAIILRDRYPLLEVAGSVCPEFGFEKDERQLTELDEFVRHSSARIVFVGLGSPKQEHLISRLRGIRSDIWWIGVGVTFSFVAGEMARAPKWMQVIGLEWLHRMVLEPRRLIRRYLIDDLPFALVMLLKAVIYRILR